MATIDKRERGENDETFRAMMVRTYSQRFNERFWEVFESFVSPKLLESPVVVDLGTGPGLFLQDMASRFPRRNLLGYDLSAVMIDHARSLPFGPDQEGEFFVHDLSQDCPVLREGSVDLMTINSVFYSFDYPIPLLDWIRKSLKQESGIFQIIDWIRVPLPQYLSFFDNIPGQIEMERRYAQFAKHNRYTLSDLSWLLESHGFQVNQTIRISPNHVVFLSKPQVT